MKKIGILFVHYGDNWIRGSERVLLDMLGAMDRERFEPYVWCNSAAMADAVRALGVVCLRSDFSAVLVYLPSTGGFRALTRQVKQGRDLIRRHDIKLVHVNSGVPTQWMVPAARLARVPLLVHLHIGYGESARHAMLLHQADAAVGCARIVLRDLERDGVDSSRLHSIPNGVSVERLDAFPSVPKQRDVSTIVCVGSLVHRKGHDVTLRALGHLAQEGIRPELLLIGSGPEEPALRQLAESLHIEQQVTWLGERPDAPAFVRDVSDIFVLSSRDEALPLVLLEAGAFGKACIATDVGGVTEVMTDEKTALIVPPDDVTALAVALRRLLADATLRTALGTAWSERVHAAHTTQAMMRQFEELYESMLRAAPPRRWALRCLPSYARYAVATLRRRLQWRKK